MPVATYLHWCNGEQASKFWRLLGLTFCLAINDFIARSKIRIYPSFSLMLGGEGQARNLSKKFFEITIISKGPPSWPFFWSGLEAPDPLEPPWRPRQFSPWKYDFFKKASNSWFLTTYLLSYHKTFQSDWRISAKKFWRPNLKIRLFQYLRNFRL